MVGVLRHKLLFRVVTFFTIGSFLPGAAGAWNLRRTSASVRQSEIWISRSQANDIVRLADLNLSDKPTNEGKAANRNTANPKAVGISDEESLALPARVLLAKYSERDGRALPVDRDAHVVRLAQVIPTEKWDIKTVPAGGDAAARLEDANATYLGGQPGLAALSYLDIIQEFPGTHEANRAGESIG